jgi:hypothetical protein
MKPLRFSLMFSLVGLALIGMACPTGLYAYASAQTSTPFTTATPFSIPAYNATVFFAIDGSYSQAVLENDTWVFNGLAFSNSVTLNSFNVSAQDCNVTLYFSGVFRGYLRGQEAGLLQYNVTGPGIQRFNFGLDPNFAVNPRYRDLMVRFSSEFFTNSSEVARMGEGWQLAADGTVTVDGAATGASIMYVDYSNMYKDASLPFYIQHSVTITAVASMLAVAALGIVLRFRLARSKPEEETQ